MRKRKIYYGSQKSWHEGGRQKKGRRSTREKIYFKQSDFPLVMLQQAQKIASAMVDNFGGGSAPPPDVALALDISPTSSAWQYLTGAAVAYGLTDGGYNAEVIKLLPLGRKLVAPEEEGEDLASRREAILRPRILREFFEKYRRAKFPNDVIAINVLKSLIPPDRAETALNIVKENGRYAGIIRDTPTGPFVSLDSPGVPAPAATPATVEEDEWTPGHAGRQTAANPSFATVSGSCRGGHFDTTGIRRHKGQSRIHLSRQAKGDR